jgi:hypothetical protein
VTNTYEQVLQNDYGGKCMWKTGGVVDNGKGQGSNPFPHLPNPFLKFLKYILFFEPPTPPPYIRGIGGGGILIKSIKKILKLNILLIK